MKYEVSEYGHNNNNEVSIVARLDLPRLFRIVINVLAL